MAAGSTIDYDALAQDAMRGVVRTVLVRAAKSGLPGDHHFYISFDTRAVGVVMSKRLKEKYPLEMTIVLQHRFWDLAVTDERFEVKLTFDGIPERLVIPYSAIKVFFDPSVSYGLQFEDPDAAGAAADGDDERRPNAITTRSSSPRKPRAPRSRNARDAEPSDRPATDTVKPVADGPRPVPRRPALAPVQNGATDDLPAGQDAAAHGTQGARAQQGEKTDDRVPAGAEIDAANKPSPAPAGGAQIVSLDAFRKK